MKNCLLGKVEHFRDVFEVSGTAFNTGLNLLIVVHDGHDCVHGGVVHLVHLVPNQDHWLCVLLAQGHSVQKLSMCFKCGGNLNSGSQCSVTESRESSSSTAYTTHTTSACNPIGN